MHKTNMLFAQKLMNRKKHARKAPAIVTGRQPHLFTNELDIGPEKNEQILVLLQRNVIL